MKEMLVDVSDDHVGIVISDQIILQILNRALRKEFGKNIHMRELRNREKLAILRRFNRHFSERGFSKKVIELYSLKVKNENWCKSLVEGAVRRNIRTIYVDYEVGQMLTKNIGIRLKLLNAYPDRELNIYSDKEAVQCADILAYGDSHQDLIRNIWKEVSVERGEI